MLLREECDDEDLLMAINGIESHSHLLLFCYFFYFIPVIRSMDRPLDVLTFFFNLFNL